MLGIHQWINAFMKAEPSWSTHFPEAHQLATKPPMHEPVRDISYSNNNALPVPTLRDDNCPSLPHCSAYCTSADIKGICQWYKGYL
jgi:hypothetical protein